MFASAKTEFYIEFQLRTNVDLLFETFCPSLQRKTFTLQVQ